MVYCGRPSANCGLCRAKKRRCDKAVPGCGQCASSGRRCQACPGYHDASSIIIRNETTRVISRKGRRKDDHLADVVTEDRLSPSPLSPFPSSSSLSSSLSSSSHPDQSQSRRHEYWDTQAVSMLVAPEAPLESLHDLAISYFLSNYVIEDSGPCPGFLNYTLEILADPLGDTEMVRLAICAAGLAGLASTPGTQSIMSRARASYAEAIERVNRSLADPLTASKDSTLFAVLVLGLFETITCAGSASLEAWAHHINGAASLLVHRGTAQFRTTLGLRIFGEAVSHVLTLCSRHGHPVPPRLRLLRVEMERRRTPDSSDVVIVVAAAAAAASTCRSPSPSWILGTAHIEVMDLYHRVDPDQDHPFLPDEWEALLSHAAELDRRLETLTANMPLHWRFKTVHDPAANPRAVYRSVYHIYYNTWVAKIWNGLRACRIILHQAIYALLLREGLAWAPHEVMGPSGGGAYTALLQRVSDTTAEMRDGILASVPQMLGFVRHDDDDDDDDGAAVGKGSTSGYRLDCSSADMPRLVPASGAYFLLWYLFLAGWLPINTPETRAWVVDRLRAIRSATGIQKAGYLADELEKQPALLVTAAALRPMGEFLLPDF
ncbi:hypothetical protein M406DRAFT_255477 [Cryphonectria parasitica EP155]|uniref:Zn(2)-C6 fungal-type domain-containing protein n=1 Tax=Cryphonectria parasitica (strain ATCC 38755 / EP155) TaxID=660469 RepID=A0A9P4Y3F2_CRYP1|nr:uncharacterized protein M406DRAFT_255477 [Cryphonectria parasitica EP155]KAF3765420.1 hypothetical protein M406DRAFT_255477 [Cryphonectria parasitica EP155]